MTLHTHTQPDPALHADPALPGWQTRSAEAARAVLRCPALRVRPLAEPVPAALLGSEAGELFAHLVRMQDGAAHANLKAAIRQALDNFEHAALRERTRHVARQLPAPQTGDELTAYCYHLPSAVLADAFGLAPAHWPAIGQEVLAMLRCIAPGGLPAEIAAGARAASQLMQRIRQQLDHPGPLLQTLAQTLERSGLANTTTLLVANAVGLWFQACEGCAGLIGQSLLQAEQQQWQGQSRDWIRQALHVQAPIQNTRRFAAEPVNLLGCPVQAGDTLLITLAGHTADGPNDLAFGDGVHACCNRKHNFAAGWKHNLAGECCMGSLCLSGPFKSLDT
ncbi:hypothetical protein [Paludibacterium sp. B53371]|uniref:hypothetical protein n=1 Tax=Paludibacterium sp. B53371 TaxID=2806263 RepID=UPI001C05B829|nr:hypothetical protein [Paludibacterium sp. B53371]